MGFCYTVILMDEFDWNYKGKFKSSELNKFEAEFPFAVKITEWHRYAVYDFDKVCPQYNNKLRILKHCDCAFYISDNSPWEINKLERDDLK